MKNLLACLVLLITSNSIAYADTAALPSNWTDSIRPTPSATFALQWFEQNGRLANMKALRILTSENSPTWSGHKAFAAAGDAARTDTVIMTEGHTVIDSNGKVKGIGFSGNERVVIGSDGRTTINSSSTPITSRALAPVNKAAFGGCPSWGAAEAFGSNHPIQYSNVVYTGALFSPSTCALNWTTNQAYAINFSGDPTNWGANLHVYLAIFDANYTYLYAVDVTNNNGQLLSYTGIPVNYKYAYAYEVVLSPTQYLSNPPLMWWDSLTVYGN